MSWTIIFRGVMVIGIAFISGCAVGPNYYPPVGRAPVAWSSPVTSGLTDSASEVSSWWTSFNDAELDSLIQRAALSNLDLRVAQARLRQSRAVREGSAADFLPSLDASSSFANAKQSQNQPLIGTLPLPSNIFKYNVYNAGFDASWEIDIFGGKRRALEAATDELEGAIESRNDVMVSLLAEVARNYMELRGSQRRLKIAEGNLKLQKEALELTRYRFQYGLVSELDVTQSAALLAGIQAAIPPLETAVRTAMYSIAVLLNQEPNDLVAELSSPMPVPSVPQVVPVGLPSDLLRRRPDVRRAERQLAAETARIGVAESDWFPKISLTGDVGTESVSFSKWFEPGSLFWSVGPSLQWRALDFARVHAQVQNQTAIQEAALATYEKVVLISMQEAENALVTYAEEQNRHRALADEVDENQRSLNMANGLYTKSRVNYLDVLDVRRSFYNSEDQLALSNQAVSLDLIALYKALGGGWETMTSQPAKASSR